MGSGGAELDALACYLGGVQLYITTRWVSFPVQPDGEELKKVKDQLFSLSPEVEKFYFPDKKDPVPDDKPTSNLTPLAIIQTENHPLMKSSADQKDIAPFELRLAPSVITRSRQKAKIEVIVEFLYPIAFASNTPAKLEMQTLGYSCEFSPRYDCRMDRFELGVRPEARFLEKFEEKVKGRKTLVMGAANVLMPEPRQPPPEKPCQPFHREQGRAPKKLRTKIPAAQSAECPFIRYRKDDPCLRRQSRTPGPFP